MRFVCLAKVSACSKYCGRPVNAPMSSAMMRVPLPFLYPGSHEAPMFETSPAVSSMSMDIPEPLWSPKGNMAPPA